MPGGRVPFDMAPDPRSGLPAPPRFLRPGPKDQDCLAHVLGRPHRMGVEAWCLWLEVAFDTPDEATVLGVLSEDHRFAEHVMRVVDRAPAIEDWIVESKLGRRGGVYRHRAGDLLPGGRFPIDRRDPTWAPGVQFPGYPGVLVPLRPKPVPAPAR